MTKAEALFHEIAENTPDVKEGKMFGALCFKTPNGKAAAMFWKEHMVFKLEGIQLEKALALEGAKLFDPMGGRPMGGWAQVPFKHAKKWPQLAKESADYVRKLKK
jgi:hypothetical protein